MSKNYNWRIKREYYNLINNGIKTLEVRVGYPDIKRVQKGDTITLTLQYNIQEKSIYEILFYSGIVENNIKFTITGLNK